jgi:hypothetical protein
MQSVKRKVLSMKALLTPHPYFLLFIERDTKGTLELVCPLKLNDFPI